MLVLLALALPATAPAATAQVIAPRHVGADVAVDDEGRAFLVTRVGELRVAPSGALFGPPRTLVSPSRTDRAMEAGVAADGGGVIVVQSDRRVRVVTFRVRGAVGQPRTVSSGRADLAASDVARSGAAAVVWFRHRKDGRWRLEAAIRDPAAAAFGRPMPVSAFVRRACCTSVSAAIGDDGDAVVTWTSTARPAVWAALRSPVGAFRRPQRLARASSRAPQAVVGAGGAAAVIYGTQHVPLRAGDGLQLHRAVRGGAFGAAEHVGAAAIGTAAVTPAGRVIVARVDQDGGRVRVSEGGPGEPLVETGALGANVMSERLSVAADGDGRAVVAWSERVSTAPAIRERAVAAMRRTRDGAIGPAVTLGRPWRAAEPAMALLVPGGGALVLWTGSRYGGHRARRAAFTVTRLP